MVTFAITILVLVFTGSALLAIYSFVNAINCIKKKLTQSTPLFIGCTVWMCLNAVGSFYFMQRIWIEGIT